MSYLVRMSDQTHAMSDAEADNHQVRLLMADLQFSSSSLQNIHIVLFNSLGH